MANLNQMNAALKSSAPEPVKFKELFTEREKALNFALLADREINRLTAAAVGPAGPVPQPGLTHLQSLAEKMRLIAHSSDAEALNITITPEEDAQFANLMGEDRLSRERIKSNAEKMSAEDREAIVRFISLFPGQAQIAGLLNVEGGEDRLRRAVDSLAYSNPEIYTEAMNAFAQSRKYVTSDWRVLKPLFSMGKKYEGVDERLIMNAIHNPDPAVDWVDQIVQAARPGLQSKWGIGATLREGWLRTKLGVMQPLISLYQTHEPNRIAQVATIDNALRQVFFEPGVASSVMRREAMLPNAPTDSKLTYDRMRGARVAVEANLNDPTEFERQARAHPLFARRNTPRARERIAQDMLDSNYRDQMNAATRAGGQGTGWEALFRLFATLFGTAYTAQDRNGLAGRIGRIP